MSDNRAPDPGEVSPDDAERLAERFKPAWEVDGDEAWDASAAAHVEPQAQGAPVPAAATAVIAVAAQPAQVSPAPAGKFRQTMVGFGPPSAEPAQPESVIAVPAPMPARPPASAPAIPVLQSPAAVTRFEDEDEADAAAFKRSRKLPIVLGFALLAVAAGAVLVANRRSEPAGHAALPVAASASAGVVAALPTPLPAEPAAGETAVSVSVPVASAPSAPSAFTGSVGPNNNSKSSGVRPEEPGPPARAPSPPIGTIATPRAALPAATPPRSAPPPRRPSPPAAAPPARPSGGGIVRDVPF